MKIFKKKEINSINGITLIALVITIIVLLILAGISISMLSGDNGILQKATEAKTLTERQSVVEQARTDILGYQAENKGGDLEKSQLKAVLDTYFEDVPTVDELPDGEDLLNREFTTLDKYGKHTIKVSEIYNGNIAGSSKIKAATLFEDKAGDEDGATEGKIHIGDYVNYNPIAQGDTGTEAKYKYQSLNDYTGMTEAISTNSLTSFTDSSQDFTTKSNLKWQVIGIDGYNILITTETPILPDNPATLQMGQTTTGYVLFGAKAYINISDQQGERNEIDNIAQIYKYGKGVDISKARGMTINDVNKVTGVTVEETTITPSGVDSMGTYGNSYNFPAPYSGSGWSPEAWLSHTSITEMPGISGTSNAYGYQKTNTNLKTSTSTIRNNLIFGESTNLKQYWLASRSVGIMEAQQCAVFGPGLINGNVAMSVYPTFLSQGNTSGYGAGIRPIIYLNSNVSLTSIGTTNNITTWNID